LVGANVLVSCRNPPMAIRGINGVSYRGFGAQR
jgi:hypothetical protein